MTWCSLSSSVGGDVMGQPMRVLISGASVGGPTAAYWLARGGCAVTVVERMSLSRVRTAVTLWTSSGLRWTWPSGPESFPR
jgi:flavin-dependent dehydrogenase